MANRKSNGSANIREVYLIAQRLEDKIDRIESRVSNVEGKAAIIAVVFSSAITVVGGLLGGIMKGDR